jgi:glycosyltransferase involved in cell wall biosynthesis
VSSIISQTYQDWEFLIIDDGSEKEETIQALHAQQHKDTRIRLVTRPHQGLTKTLNFGLRLSRGEFICRQDSDDWSEATRIEKQTKFMHENPGIAVVGSWVVYHQENGNPLWMVKLPRTAPEISSYLPNNPFCHGATCFRRAAAVALGGYREDLPSAQDYDFFWRMFDRYSGSNLPVALYHFRFTRGSVSTRKAKEQKIAARVIREFAAARRVGQPANYHMAHTKVENELGGVEGELLGKLKTYDRWLLAGYKIEAVLGFARIVLRHPACWITWMKFLRSIVYTGVPLVRRNLFSHS